MDLRQLEMLRAIAEMGSFTAAGHKLHVSQSAISRQVSLLEQELGAPIFYRVGRRVRITAVGKTLLQLSKRVFQDMRDTLTEISDQQESLRGALGLVGGMSVCLYVFPTLLTDLRRVHPQLDLNITGGSGERCVSELRAGKADLGLLTLPIVAHDLVTVPAVQEELLVITEPNHPLASQERIGTSDLRTQPFVLFEAGSNTRRVIDEFFLREHIEPRIVMETENVEIIKAMVRTGIGIGVVPYQAVAAEVATRQLFCSRVAGHTLHRETGWVYPKMSRVPRTVSEVITAFSRVQPHLQFAPER